MMSKRDLENQALNQRMRDLQAKLEQKVVIAP